MTAVKTILHLNKPSVSDNTMLTTINICDIVGDDSSVRLCDSSALVSPKGSSVTSPPDGVCQIDTLRRSGASSTTNTTIPTNNITHVNSNKPKTSTDKTVGQLSVEVKGCFQIDIKKMTGANNGVLKGARYDVSNDFLNILTFSTI